MLGRENRHDYRKLYSSRLLAFARSCGNLYIQMGDQEMAKKESAFQAQLIKDLKKLYPGCVVLKNDSSYIQGFPDLTIFYEDRWAVLECKKSENEPHQPNQDHYVKTLNDMSYSSFIFPENKEKVLNELEQTFKPGRCTRISGSK